VDRRGRSWITVATGAFASAAIIAFIAFLTGCSGEAPTLSLEEGCACAKERYRDHPGTFALEGSKISYSYESKNGPAKVIVTFDRQRPISTFFESAPYGSHEELMDAVAAIKNCVAYGTKPKPAMAGG